MEKREVAKIRADSGQRVMVPASTDPPRRIRISSASLLQGQRHIVIEHVGREYRLHLTAKGKLILTG